MYLSLHSSEVLAPCDSLTPHARRDRPTIFVYTHATGGARNLSRAMSSRPSKKQREQERVNATYYYESGEAAQEHGEEEEDDNMDTADLPVEGGTVDEQIGSILDGSSDEEIVDILSQLPALNDGMKIIIGMQKLSVSAMAFTVLQPVADACINEGLLFLYNKIGGLTQAQVDSDIAGVYEDDPPQIAALMSHPPERRRRLFFMSLAAGYLGEGEEED